MGDRLCIAELVVGIIGLSFALWSFFKSRSEREWVHTALVNLKPAIQGENKAQVITAINDMLAFLKPPKKTKP